MESFVHLLHGNIQCAKLSTSIDDLQGELERPVLYSLEWTIGGIFKVEDLIHFLSKISPGNMPG